MTDHACDEALWRAALDLAADPIFLVDRARMQLIDANEAACRLLDSGREQLCGAALQRLAAEPPMPELAAALDAAAARTRNSPIRLCLTAPSGRRVPLQCQVRVPAGPASARLALLARPDHAASSAADAQGNGAPATLACDPACAHHARGAADLCALRALDSVTGLPDRRLLTDRLRAELESPQRHGQAALLFIDLNGFKAVNDAWGHLVGDRVLAAVADRLRQCVRGGDLVARYGGDEFLVLLPSVRCPSDAMLVAQRILARLADPIGEPAQPISISASIGVAMADSMHRSPEQVLDAADRAMYQSKALGRICAADEGETSG